MLYLSGFFTNIPTYIPGWKTTIIPIIILYLYLVRQLRYRRAKRTYGYHNRASFSHMTYTDAHSIITQATDLEFPSVASVGAGFAIIKTFGIPSISTLLHQTGQISSIQKVHKRVTDTGCLIIEAAFNPPASKRSIDAIARINHLHAPYLAAGKINSDDMLYVLSLFAREQWRWIDRYEWRKLTELELCALGVFWRILGEALGVGYGRLEHAEKGWRDGLEWLRDLDAWGSEYERRNMQPAETNRKLAENSIDSLLWNVPGWMKPVARSLVAALFEDQLRDALFIPKPSEGYFEFISTVIAIRKFITRHLLLPKWKPKKRVSATSLSGRRHMLIYRVEPWYFRPTVWSRWSPEAWKVWLRGGILPGDEGGKYRPEGYLIEELGPRPVRKCEREKIDEDMERIKAIYRAGICPFLR